MEKGVNFTDRKSGHRRRSPRRIYSIVKYEGMKPAFAKAPAGEGGEGGIRTLGTVSRTSV